MSIKLIESSKTKMSLIDGVVTYTNPQIKDYLVYADGRIKNIETNRFLNKTSNGLYSISYTRGSTYSNPTAYDSLISRLLNINKGHHDKLVLINESNGYVTGNIKTVTTSRQWNEPKKPAQTKSPITTIDPSEYKADEVTINGFIVRSHRQDHVFVTEDGVQFKTKDLAMTHQDIIDKGKDAARSIIAAKAGWVLAESIFLKFTENTTIKYTHFREFIEGNIGIAEKLENTSYQFINQPNLGEYSQILISTSYDKETIEKITSELNILNKIHEKLLSIICE